MKAPFSTYLSGIKSGLQQLIGLLRKEYDYVSILATDSKGLAVRISQKARSVSSETMTTERGIVVRVCKDGLYSEYALNSFDPQSAEAAAEVIRTAFQRQRKLLMKTGTKVFRTPVLPDEPMTLFVEKETEQLPETADVEALVAELTGLSDEAMKLGKDMLDCQTSAQSTHISKMFLTEHRDLSQSYVYSEGTVVAIVSRDGHTQFGYEGVSGLSGPEIFGQLRERASKSVRCAEELLDAERIEPGEYEIITSPEVTGLIAHEAFGHGVEMDMFVKNRALGREYVGRRVGSDLVTMHEGALCAEDVTSYVFDDEGNLAGDVTEIENGVLKTGICDALSALRLGTEATGNGKRENFEHKVYTRMTNTVFDSGTDRLEDMIASIGHGYLLEGMESGMEDPKHWGIQCIVKLGREIRNGRLTGRVAAPIIMTGYVPELLGNISMCSADREIFGNGGCGKGHKEWVKVADGGPYLKTKARLG
ncbi:MAG: TldD/PmbA family protein [Oscillospiraceae bacterium]|nr:TldD/PmbA family protein [Oscillospiraceae bacterium]